MSLLAVSGGGLVARLDPRTRLVAAMGFAVLAVALDHPLALGLALALAVVAALAARLPLWPTLRRMLALDGFMVLALITLPFTVPGDAVMIGGIAGLTPSRQGVAQAVAIMLKTNGVVLMVLALAGTMDAVTLGRSLAQLGMPAKLVQLYLFTVRYLDVLHQEYARLRIAMRARAFVMGCNRHSWISLGYLFGMLMVRSLDRAERIERAMRCRGFDGHFPQLTPERAGFRLSDGMFAAASLAGSLILVTVDVI